MIKGRKVDAFVKNKHLIARKWHNPWKKIVWIPNRVVNK